MIVTDKLVECVPNFSEGRDLAKMEQLLDCFRGKSNVKLLDYSNDFDHNRMVITAVGEPSAVKKATIEAICKAVEIIDLRQHQGVHPRLGAADVIPFIPLRNMSMPEAVNLAVETGKEVAKRLQLPVYLYEEAATAPHRRNLAEVRKGQFEGLNEKMRNPLWKPDFGPSAPHVSAGASIVGARNFLIAWNVNLKTTDLKVAKNIARSIRFSSGGFPCVKALGLELREQNMVQVSMNLTDFTQTGMMQVFEHIQKEARLCGVEIAGSELIGMLPLQAVADAFAQAIQLDDFHVNRVLEYRLLE